MRTTICVAISLIFIMACVSGGTKAITDAGVISQIEVGKSTKVEVKSLLGEPASVGWTDSGEEEWSYFYMRGTPRAASLIPVVGLFAGGTDMKTENLKIRFDKNGVVKYLGRGRISATGGSILD